MTVGYSHNLKLYSSEPYIGIGCLYDRITIYPSKNYIPVISDSKAMSWISFL